MTLWRALVASCGSVFLALDTAALQVEIVELTPVSVCRDATFSIPTSRGAICSGSGNVPHGVQCPRIGDEASNECYPYLASFNGTNCIAQEDAQCIQLADRDAWGCSFPSSGCSSEEETPTATDKPTQSHTCSTWDFFELSSSEGDPFDVEYTNTPSAWFTQTTTTTQLYNCKIEAVTTAPLQVQCTSALPESTDAPAPILKHFFPESTTESDQPLAPSPTSTPEPVQDQEEAAVISTPTINFAITAAPTPVSTATSATLAPSELPEHTEAPKPLSTSTQEMLPETASPSPSLPNMMFPPCTPIPNPDTDPPSTEFPTFGMLAPVNTEPVYPVPTPTPTEQTPSIPMSPQESIEAPTIDETRAPTSTKTASPVYIGMATQAPTATPCNNISAHENEHMLNAYETLFPTEALTSTPASSSPQIDKPASPLSSFTNSSVSVDDAASPGPTASPTPGSDSQSKQEAVQSNQQPLAITLPATAFSATTSPASVGQLVTLCPSAITSSQPPVVILKTPCPPTTAAKQAAITSPPIPIAVPAQTSVEISKEFRAQITTSPASTTPEVGQPTQTPCPSTMTPASNPSVTLNTVSMLQVSTQSSLPSSIAAVGISIAAVAAIVLAVVSVVIVIVAIFQSGRRNSLSTDAVTEHHLNHSIVLSPSDI